MAGNEEEKQKITEAFERFRDALFWYYTRISQVEEPVEKLVEKGSHSQAGYWFSDTHCEYVTGVGLNRPDAAALKYLAEEYLPHQCHFRNNYYCSIQFIGQSTPASSSSSDSSSSDSSPSSSSSSEGYSLIDSQLDKALVALTSPNPEVLSSPLPWEVVPLLIMVHDLEFPAEETASSTSRGEQQLQLWRLDELSEESAQAEGYKAFETVCSLAFEYIYRADITAVHSKMEPARKASDYAAHYVRAVGVRPSDGKIVGITAFLFDPRQPIAYVSEVAVRPSQQRKGYGVAMMEATLRYIRERGCRQAVLTSTAAGLSLYLKTGFRVVPGLLAFMITSAPDVPPSGPPFDPVPLEEYLDSVSLFPSSSS